MTRWWRQGVAACALAAVPWTAPAPAGADGVRASTCEGRRPTALTFSRTVGEPAGRLTWRGSRLPARGRYRVYRNRTVVGQTRRRAMAVRVRPGFRYVFRVRVVSRGRIVRRCGRRLTREIRFAPPGPVPGLAVSDVDDRGGSLSWVPAAAGDAPIAGYRVLRDGETLGQPLVVAIRVELPSSSTATYTVAAVDTRGNAGPPSPPATVTTGHRPPVAPEARLAHVGDTSVSLAWSDGPGGSRPVVGHRIYRDGAAVGQVGGESSSVDGLAPATAYTFAVTAVDSLGYESEPSAPLTVSTALPPQSTGKVHAFLLASTDMSFRDLQDHYRQIGTLYPTYYECEPDGTITGSDDPLVSRWARLRGIAVLDRVNCQSPTRLHRILTDPATRAATLDRLEAIAAESGHEGLNLDFEAGAATDRDALTAFVADLAARLHAQGRRLAVEVSAKVKETFTGRSGFYDYAGIARSADTVFVMAWGKHWTTSGPGAMADLPWATQVADYVATMPDRSRFVFGTALYGIDWANGGGAAHPGTPLEYSDVMALMARVGAVAEFDPVAHAPHFSYVDGAGAPHEVWYTDARTVAAHVRLAADRRLGFGVWRLGSEDQEVWSNPLLAPLP